MNATTSTLRVCIGDSGIPVGTLWLHNDPKRLYSGFQYDESWINRRHGVGFALSPDMPLTPERQFFRTGTEQPHFLPPPLADTLPDLWGRQLVRAWRKTQTATLSAPLSEIDYLLSADDRSRMGALRIQAHPGSPFLAQSQTPRHDVPPVFELTDLALDIARIERQHPNRNVLARLIDISSALGGARPKCSVIEKDGALALAKFTSQHDTRAVEKAEVLTLDLARRCGIDASQARLVHCGQTPVAVIRRFDRAQGGRIHYLSAQSFLNAETAVDSTYVEFADRLREHAADPKKSLHELFDRVSFMILVGNTDDHLKNHGLLHVGEGRWALSPMFDVNPAPEREKRLKTAIVDPREPDASLERLFEHAEFFDLKTDEACERIVAQAQTIRRHWKAMARDIGMTTDEIRDFAPAFENEQSRLAIQWGLARITRGHAP